MFFRKKTTLPADPRFFIQWHLTDSCNLHCAHCYQADAPLRTMSFDDCLKMLDRLDDFFHERQVQPQINLTGGEPLLHPQLFELIDCIRERGWHWALLTNGILLNDTIIEQIRHRRPVFVQLSLEGPEEINDACRGPHTFQKILSAADALTQANIKTLISFTVTSRNWRSFPELAQICREHHIHKLWCDRYVGSDDQCISTQDYQSFLQLLRHEKEKSTKTTKISADRSLQFLAGGDGYLCGAGRSLLVFLPDGDMLPCRRLPLSLGNALTADSIQALLDTSPIWSDLNRLTFDTHCIACADLQRCRGGAKCVTYAQTGYLHARDVNCPLR